ncbi:MAG: EamA family transporter [Thermosynechococcaceae cyanobacterium]
MKNVLNLLLLILTQSLGDMWLSKGMKVFGHVEFNLLRLDQLIVYLFTSPWIWLGVLTLICSLLLYMTAISRLDLSYVLPIHSFTHVLNAFLAWLVLGESVSGIRWLATIMITIGVLIVGLSQSHTDRSKAKVTKERTFFKRNHKSNLSIFLFPLGLYLSKIWVGILVVVFADATGDVLTAVGMKQVGRVTLGSFSEMLRLVKTVFLNRVIISAIAFHALAFFIFISLLSWADISLIRPATALTYVLSLLGAYLFLNEQITRGRLAGIAMIGGGVALISYS